MKRLLFITLGISLILTACGGSGAVVPEMAKVELKTVFPKDADQLERCQTATGMSEAELSAARATLTIVQRHGRTAGIITVIDAMPDTIFTIWIRISGTSPLTGKPLTPFANVNDYITLAQTAPDAVLTDAARVLGAGGNDGSGSADLSVLLNAFQTDSEGNGKFAFDLDYMLIGGVLPFERLDSTLEPVAIRSAETEDARIVSIVSHCASNRGYGLVAEAVANESWFDLTVNPFGRND